jgi:small subunit ribosomal protein S1
MSGNHPLNPEPASKEENAPQENSGSFESLLNQHSVWNQEKFHDGALVEGKVVAVRAEGVVVDIGYKSEGMIPLDEFRAVDGKVHVKPGDTVEVLVEFMDQATGALRLSRRRAWQAKAWETLREAFQHGYNVKGRITECVKGGLVVDIGLRAFLPGSLVDVRKVGNLEKFVGQEVEVKIIQIDRRRNNIVVSRREVVEKEKGDQRRQLAEKLSIGKLVEGTVKNLTSYGAFVDVGGLDGLLHISDMSWKRLNHPSEMFKAGDKIEVMVLDVNQETGKISLGYKQKTRDPWEDAEARYASGVRVKGKVVSLKGFGAFVELEDGIEGLIHVGDLSWTNRFRHPNQVLKAGDEVEAVVLKYDTENRRLLLGVRQLEPNPWEEFSRTHFEGQRVHGKVKNLVEFGAFVELQDGIDGLIHVSDMSWTERIAHPSQILKKGQDVEAVIRGIDVENGRVSLSLKHTMPNVWDTFFATHKAGDVVKGKVVRLTEYGAFVEIEPGIEGLAHISELAQERIEKPSQVLNPGDEIEFKVIRLNPRERKIGLSRKAMLPRAERPHEERGERERGPRREGRGRREQPPAEARSEGDGSIRLGDVIGKTLSSFIRSGEARKDDEEPNARS